MAVHAQERKLDMRTRVLCIALLLAVCCTAAASAATPPTRSNPLPGTWTGSYGGAFTGTFTIHWKLVRTRLVGTIHLSRPNGTYGITGSVKGSAIKFGAVGVGARYSGSVSGKSMSGRYTTPQGGGSWSASKAS
jgi:hypothetical protein